VPIDGPATVVAVVSRAGGGKQAGDKPDGAVSDVDGNGLPADAAHSDATAGPPAPAATPAKPSDAAVSPAPAATPAKPSDAAGPHAPAATPAKPSDAAVSPAPAADPPTRAGVAASAAASAPAAKAARPTRGVSAGTAIADAPTGAVWMPARAASGKVRNRLLPRTVLGVAAMVLAAAIGAAFSGVVLYSYYEYRLSQNTDKINTFIGTYKKQFDNAKGDLNAQRAAAQAEINKDLGPLRQLQASSDTLQALVKKVGPSMYFVHTLDANGQPSVGSAFVIASDANQSLLLTSYNTVQAATHKPGPDLLIRQGGVDAKVTVWTWDERYDLALIVLPKGNLAHLDPAPVSPVPALGDRVFAVSGLGSLGASAVQGVVTDVSASGLQHTSAIGQAYQGGPLLNANGQVIAVASRSYQPLNFASDSVWFAPYLRSACDKVLNCPGGTISGQPGGQRTG
jgi:S1-C subfamily serine protease